MRTFFFSSRRRHTRSDRDWSSDVCSSDLGFGGGGGMGGMPIGTGGLGIGGMVVLGLIGWALGIDPFLLINGANIIVGGNQGGYEQPSRPPQQQDARRTGTPSDEAGRFVARVLGS